MKKTNNKLLRKQYCHGKTIYDKKGAITMSNCLMKHGKGKLRAYQCEECNMWHLTHMDKELYYDL